jgi:archaellum biogenesis protein FlaJ (TadC family)
LLLYPFITHNPDDELTHNPDDELTHNPDDELTHNPDDELTYNPDDELFLRSRSNIISISRQVFLFFYTIVVFVLLGYILFLGVFAFIPPQGFPLGAFVTSLLIIASFVLTRPTTYPSRNGQKFSHETWLFVNGVCTDRGWLERNCEMLAKTFGRKILGIHNRTFGPVFDGLECIIQRDFGYTTDDVRQLYAVAKQELRKEDNHKVVLIGHSQVRI